MSLFKMYVQNILINLTIRTPGTRKGTPVFAKGIPLGQDRCNKPLYCQRHPFGALLCMRFCLFKDCKSKRKFDSCKINTYFVLLLAEIRKSLLQVFVFDFLSVCWLAGIQLKYY